MSIIQPIHKILGGWAGGLRGGLFDCDCACAAPPDYTATAAASDKAAQLSYQSAKDDLDFRKQVYQDSIPQQKSLYDLAAKISQQQVDSADKQTALADQNQKYWENTYKPIEQQTAMDAVGSRYLGDADKAKLAAIMNGTSGLSGSALTSEMDRITQAAQEGAATKAVTQTEADANTSYAMGVRGLSRMGMDPNKLASAAATLASGQTLAKATAANAARDGINAQGQALRTGVANFGRNMPNTAATQVSLGTNAGNSAVSNATTGFNSGLTYPSYVSGGTNNIQNAAALAQSGVLGIANLQNQAYIGGLQAQANGSSGSGNALGTIAGALITQFSDVRLKRNLVKVGKTAKGFTRYMWQYLWGEWAVGVLAQEVEKILPEAVFTGPDGWKRVNLSMVE